MYKSGYTVEEYLEVMKDAYFSTFKVKKDELMHPEDIGMNLSIINEAVFVSLTWAMHHNRLEKADG